MGRDYLMEQAEYLKKDLKKDLGKHNISQTLFQRIDYRRKAPCGIYDAQ